MIVVRNLSQPAEVPPHRRRKVVALDIGKQSDPTALSLLEWELPVFRPGMAQAPAPPVYHVVTLKRWPLGTPYMEIGRKLVKFLELPELWGAVLVIDRSGVGDAVAEIFIDQLNRAQTKANGFVMVTITAGAEVTHVGPGAWRVAKVQLCSIIKMLLSTGRLVVLPGVPERKTLIDELQNFQIKLTAAANETFEARQGRHDDMVLSVALGCWAAESLDWNPPVQVPRRLVT